MRSIFIVILTFCATVASAQPRSAVGQDPKNVVVEKKDIPKWKKPIEQPNATVTAAWAPLEVEHYFGIRGGYGIGSGRFEPIKNMQSYMGMYNFGLSYKLDVPKQRFVGAIEFGIEYMEKGFQYETYFESEIGYRRKYSMISIPILWQPYLPFTKSGESRLYLNAGPNVGYALSSSYETVDLKTGETSDQGQWSYDQLRDNRWEYGVVLGAGVIVAIKKRVTFGVDFRYNIMLSDIFKGVNKYPGNPFRSPVDVMNLSFKVEVKLWDGKKKKIDKNETNN